MNNEDISVSNYIQSHKALVTHPLWLWNETPFLYTVKELVLFCIHIFLLVCHVQIWLYLFFYLKFLCSTNYLFLESVLNYHIIMYVSDEAMHQSYNLKRKQCHNSLNFQSHKPRSLNTQFQSKHSQNTHNGPSKKLAVLPIP